MRPTLIRIIPFLHGKITVDGKLNEPDIYDILDKWLARHPEIKQQQREIRISRGRYTLPEGVRTELISASITWTEDIANYDPVQDADLYQTFLADDQGY